ncbi:MAG: polysaccharide deacetylase family protein [Acidobacteria bacterium]|nr:polysaccharide deacetylase family protein [Acidobacteriota bacterium]
MTRREMLGMAAAFLQGVPEKTVVLTFDDAVKSHRTFVAPLLAELGFRATFFVTHRWMEDRENFMTWEDIADLHRMGFEIGNHSWTHANFSIPRNAARLAGELALVENELRKVSVPKPSSFAWCGNFFGPEAIEIVTASGFKLARRGGAPEVEYGKVVVGPALDVKRHHPLLIPTTGDAYPDWTFEHFQKVAAQARDGRIVVLQFHGVPDKAHPWVHTPPEMFKRYMQYLKENGYRTLALRDLEAFYDWRQLPRDPLLQARHRAPKGKLVLPAEVEATQQDLSDWTGNMGQHRYTPEEASRVAGIRIEPAARRSGGLLVLPYPGGRHTRIGFLDGAIDPLRGTKASVFLPWPDAGYVVLDVPEAIFSNLGLLFLAHTHVPTIWNAQNIVIGNRDWQRRDGALVSSWELPNKVAFGATLRVEAAAVEMELWLRNGTSAPLAGLRTQICVLTKGAPDFNGQTNENKILRQPLAGVRSRDGKRWILTQWERCGRVWGNPQCPCLHSDPVLPDCPPGEQVRVRGRLWFQEGADAVVADLRA